MPLSQDLVSFDRRFFFFLVCYSYYLDRSTIFEFKTEGRRLFEGQHQAVVAP